MLCSVCFLCKSITRHSSLPTLALSTLISASAGQAQDYLWMLTKVYICSELRRPIPWWTPMAPCYPSWHSKISVSTLQGSLVRIGLTSKILHKIASEREGFLHCLRHGFLGTGHESVVLDESSKNKHLPHSTLWRTAYQSRYCDYGACDPRITVLSRSCSRCFWITRCLQVLVEDVASWPVT